MISACCQLSWQFAQAGPSIVVPIMIVLTILFLCFVFSIWLCLKKMKKNASKICWPAQYFSTSNCCTNLKKQVQELNHEKAKKSQLLSNILPSRNAATSLVKGFGVKPQTFQSVTLLFTNILNFQQISKSCSPFEVFSMLNDLNHMFDSIVGLYNVCKVETVKDTYFVASGMRFGQDDHPSQIGHLALDFITSAKTYKSPSQLSPILLRIGIHLGPVASGIIGLDKPRCCLFGDTVNTVSRLSTTGEPLRIQISSEYRDALQAVGGFVTEDRGFVYMKGKGQVLTYWLVGLAV